MAVADSICVVMCGAVKCSAFCLLFEKSGIILRDMVYCLCNDCIREKLAFRRISYRMLWIWHIKQSYRDN